MHIIELFLHQRTQQSRHWLAINERETELTEKVGIIQID